MSVSVAMAVYNGESFLRAQLDSIADQTRPPDEMVIADDGSCDGSLAIAEQFAAQAPFPVTILRGETNIGYAKNFMRVADACRSPLILFADQDDIWHPEKIAVLAAVDVAAGAALISHDAAIVSERPGIASCDSYHALLEATGFPPAICFKGCCLAVRREAIDLWGWPPASIDVSHDFWLALLATGLDSRTLVSRPLVRHRLHATNSSGWIAAAKDLVYTPVERLGSRSDLELMIELCIKSWRLDWTGAFVQVLDRLAADGLADQSRLALFKAALLANHAWYDAQTAASIIREPDRAPLGDAAV